MSHHFDLIHPDETRAETPEASAIRAMDISDVFCFAGPSDDDGPRTVIGMNASPQFFTPDSDPWNPPAGPYATLYELKLDLNDDLVEDITWRFTFSEPDPSTGEPKYFQVAQLTGADATSRTAPGTIITPANARVGKVLCLPGGIKVFVGKRLDSFFTDVHVPVHLRAVLPPGPGESADPGLGALAPYSDSFAGQLVRLVMVELPATITGLDRIQCWGSIATADTTLTPVVWTQVQRAAGADTAVVFGGGQDPYHKLINSTGPSADLTSGAWEMVRDQVATVVGKDGINTFGDGKNGRPTPQAYGEFVADTLLPDVLPFTPGTTALWDPWNGVKNGKGLHEELASAFARMVTNTPFDTGLKHPPLHDHFPYLSPPPDD
jgi:hypothetical protein